MSQHNDDILTVTGGPTVNDGKLAFYLANGATTANLVDATMEFLLARGVTLGYKNDMWHEFLTGIVSLPMTGTISEMKANWWANGAPLI